MIKKTDVFVGLAKTTLEQWAVLAAVVDEGGFAQAALALGDKTKARALDERLVALAAAADGDRTALAEAKAFLAGN